MGSKKITVYLVEGHEDEDYNENPLYGFSAYFLKKEHAKIAVKTCKFGQIKDVKALQTDSNEVFVDIDKDPIKTVDLKEFLLERALNFLKKSLML